MSSAVNKSSKRFVPKIGSRGSSIRAPVRRNTRRSFSVPSRSESNATATQPEAEAALGDAAQANEPKTKAELLGITADEIAQGSGSAIDDTPIELTVAQSTDSPADQNLVDRRSSILGSASPAKQRDVEHQPVPTGSAPDTLEEPTQTTQVDTPQSTILEPTASGKTGASGAIEDTVTDALQIPESTLLEAPNPPKPSYLPTVTPQSLRQPSMAKRAPPPVQPVGPHPTRLSTLTAPRRPPMVKRPTTARQGPLTSTARAATAAPRAAKPQPASARPEAPPGYQIIEPEDLRDLKREERRRREAWESAQMKLMRELFVEKEHKRLIDEESYDEASSMRVAQVTSETLTFNALKQAVMSELKEYKEKMEKEKAKELEQQAKRNGASGNRGSEAAPGAASVALGTANSILEPGSEPPLKQLINVEKFKMSDLCKDIPVGMPNDKYDDYENARVQRRRDRLLLLRAKNWKRNALKREPSEAEKAMLESVYAKFKNERLARSDKVKEESERKLKSLDDGARSGPAPAPTLEIGQDGQIRIEHTQVDRHMHNRSNQSESAQNKVEVDETQKTINSYSFSTKERPERWSKEETQKFYEALSAWGTDFNLIAHLFPTRSRHQIKTKFKYEERRNSIKVQMYLVHRRKVNVNSYAEVSDQQIEDVKDIEEALERVRDEHEERMKIEQTAREQARSEDQEKQEQQSPKRRAQARSMPAPKRERLR